MLADEVMSLPKQRAGTRAPEPSSQMGLDGPEVELSTAESVGSTAIYNTAANLQTESIKSSIDGQQLFQAQKNSFAQEILRLTQEHAN